MERIQVPELPYEGEPSALVLVTEKEDFHCVRHQRQHVYHLNLLQQFSLV